MTSITAHGATLTVSNSGVQVVRTPMGQTLLPAILDIPANNLRGWYLNAPTATSPGWLQFSLAHLPDDAVARPIRGYPATHGVSTVVAFAPGQMESFAAANAALIALQGGYRIETSPVTDGAHTAHIADAMNTDPATGSAAANTGGTAAASSTSASQAPLPLFELPEPLNTPRTNPAASASAAKKSSSWRRVSTPDHVPEPDLTADADGPVFGQNVTITGDFEPYDKGDVWNMIASAGGSIGKNVTKKTTMLILGDWGSVTSKEKRARELVEKGQDITIWTFNEFLTALGKAPRPTFSEVKGTDAPF